MPTMMEKLFPPADRERVKRAVEEAEKRTSGEIVPYVVERCDPYEAAEWRAGSLLAMLFLGTFAVLHTWSSAWLPVDVGLLVGGGMAAFLLGMAAARFVPAVERVFAGAAAVDRRMQQRAAEAFVAEEVFATRDRTGILLFIGLFEHKVLVLGDSGINAKVKKEDWEAVVGTVVAGIRRGAPADGLVEAIAMCGSLLERHGVARRADDRDELSGTLRMRPR